MKLIPIIKTFQTFKIINCLKVKYFDLETTNYYTKRIDVNNEELIESVIEEASNNSTTNLITNL